MTEPVSSAVPSVGVPPVDTPFRINLEQQKKRAKELLKAIRANDALAFSRFEKNHPDYNNHLFSFEHAKLSDAQLVLARELGLASWPKLKAHIQAMDDQREAIKINAAAPDVEFKTLHIRCGSDLQTKLPDAGFVGDFLEYTEAYVQGPVIHNNKFKETRLKFLHQAYGSFLNKTYEEIRYRDEQSEIKLRLAAGKYERVVLWFEHDSFDQLILARIMAYFFANECPAIFEMVSINHFPGSARFIGLGQLPADAIRLIWQKRKPVTRQQLTLGNTVWLALGDSTPQQLLNIMRSNEISHLENMHDALLRHLQELPSTFNGLGLTEQITLELLKEESVTAGQLFGKLMRQRDPLPWLGDIMYWYILQNMMKVAKPVFEISDENLVLPWSERMLTITSMGEKVLDGEIDWLTFMPPERWVGGLKITSNDLCWRWNKKKSLSILC